MVNPKCPKGYKLKENGCVKSGNSKNIFKKINTQNFFYRYLDLFLLIPILYGFLATQINRFIFGDFGSPLPSIWFGLPELIGVWFVWFLTALTIIGIILGIFRAIKWKTNLYLRIVRWVVPLFSTGWYLFVLISINSFSRGAF